MKKINITFLIFTFLCIDIKNIHCSAELTIHSPYHYTPTNIIDFFNLDNHNITIPENANSDTILWNKLRTSIAQGSKKIIDSNPTQDFIKYQIKTILGKIKSISIEKNLLENIYEECIHTIDRKQAKYIKNYCSSLNELITNTSFTKQISSDPDWFNQEVKEIQDEFILYLETNTKTELLDKAFAIYQKFMLKKRNIVIFKEISKSAGKIYSESFAVPLSSALKIRLNRPTDPAIENFMSKAYLQQYTKAFIKEQTKNKSLSKEQIKSHSKNFYLKIIENDIALEDKFNKTKIDIFNEINNFLAEKKRKKINFENLDLNSAKNEIESSITLLKKINKPTKTIENYLSGLEKMTSHFDAYFIAILTNLENDFLNNNLKKKKTRKRKKKSPKSTKEQVAQKNMPNQETVQETIIVVQDSEHQEEKNNKKNVVDKKNISKDPNIKKIKQSRRKTLTVTRKPVDTSDFDLNVDIIDTTPEHITHRIININDINTQNSVSKPKKKIERQRSLKDITLALASDTTQKKLIRAQSARDIREKRRKTKTDKTSSKMTFEELKNYFSVKYNTEIKSNGNKIKIIFGNLKEVSYKPGHRERNEIGADEAKKFKKFEEKIKTYLSENQ